MTFLFQNTIRPLAIPPLNTADPVINDWSKRLLNEINHTLIATLEDNAQRVKLGMDADSLTLADDLIVEGDSTMTGAITTASVLTAVRLTPTNSTYTKTGTGTYTDASAHDIITSAFVNGKVHLVTTEAHDTSGNLYLGAWQVAYLTSAVGKGTATEIFNNTSSAGGAFAVDLTNNKITWTGTDTTERTAQVSLLALGNAT